MLMVFKKEKPCSELLKASNNRTKCAKQITAVGYKQERSKFDGLHAK
jgi:hypothetical protein